jgi:O-antigen chain-terminating methyltransferase
MDDESPDLRQLRRKLDDEESAYASLLAALDALAAFPLPLERLPDQPALMGKLNALWEEAPAPEARGLAGRSQRKAWDALAPARRRQVEFNSVLVQVLNAHLDETARLHSHLRDLAGTLVRYLQRLLPVIDARDRLASALSTTRTELVLEAFDRRLEALARRLEGLLAMRDRLGAVSEEVRAVRGALEAGPPPPAVAAAAAQAAADSTYAAFENRFRGGKGEIRERLASYAALFEGLAPVVDLGCGRGEFLETLREKGTLARGVEGNVHLARECRLKGLDVTRGDLLAFLRAEADVSLGGVFAAQVAEHLPPAVLEQVLREAHRVLRPGGLLVLETVNPRSVVGFLEVYNRDLTHERPLHPDTLSFLAAACGFTDVRVELRSPVDPAARLQAVPAEGLPPRAAEALNENVARLNGLLYGPQEYALLARR